MPKALVKDWKLAESLYMQGVSTTDIAKDLEIPIGTLAARIKRNGWAKRRNDVSRDVSETLANRSKQWRLWSIDAVDRLMKAFAALPQGRIAKVGRQDVQNLKDLVETGLKAYGLDKDQGGVKVSIGVYAGGECIRNVSGGETKPTQTVDIQASVED